MPVSEPRLVVEPEKIAGRLGVELPLTDRQREDLVDAILDAQADVEGYLNRPLFAVPLTIANTYVRSGYSLDSPLAWPVESLDDEVTVVSYEAQPDGTWTLNVLVGLDGPNVREVVRFVTAHAVEATRANPSVQMGVRQVSSVSAEGQSISYERSPSGEGAAAAPPTLKSLRRHRRLSIARTPSARIAPWPYDGNPVGYTP